MGKLWNSRIVDNWSIYKNITATCFQSKNETSKSEVFQVKRRPQNRKWRISGGKWVIFSNMTKISPRHLGQNRNSLRVVQEAGYEGHWRDPLWIPKNRLKQPNKRLFYVFQEICRLITIDIDVTLVPRVSLLNAKCRVPPEKWRKTERKAALRWGRGKRGKMGWQEKIVAFF